MRSFFPLAVFDAQRATQAHSLLLATVGIDREFHFKASAKLIESLVPATVGLATLGMCALSGALLHPSSKARMQCLCHFHPRYLYALFGLVLLCGNCATAFGVKRPKPILSLYFGAPALLMLIVVLLLRIVVSRTLAAKTGAVAILGGIGVIGVGVVVLTIMHQAYGCGIYTARLTDSGCPLPSYFDAEAVFMCFLAAGMLSTFVGAQRIAYEAPSAATAPLLVDPSDCDSPAGSRSEKRRSKYFVAP